MIDLLKLFGGVLVGLFSRARPAKTEVAFLRQQILVLKRSLRQPGSGCELLIV
jgi:hypothetical protein